MYLESLSQFNNQYAMHASDPAIVVSKPITPALYAVSNGIVKAPSVITPFMIQPPNLSSQYQIVS